MWHCYHLIREGDLLTASTFRSVLHGLAARPHGGMPNPVPPLLVSSSLPQQGPPGERGRRAGRDGQSAHDPNGPGGGHRL